MWNPENNAENNYYYQQNVVAKKEKHQLGDSLSSGSKVSEVKQIKGESLIRCKICNSDSSCIHKTS